MDSTLALAITRVILEEMNKETDEEVPKAVSQQKRTSRKATVKKQEKKNDGNNSNC